MARLGAAAIIPAAPPGIPRGRVRHGRPPPRERAGLSPAADGPGSSRSSRPSRWPTSATWRWPIRRASPPPARRSSPIPPTAALTSRANLVAVITNGTAVLGLGAIGPLAAKPVMEGRPSCSRSSPASTYSTSRVDETRPASWWMLLPRWSRPSAASTWRTSRRRNASPSRQLRDRMHIPVFHDDQHGTAIIVAAACATASRCRARSWPR